MKSGRQIVFYSFLLFGIVYLFAGFNYELNIYDEAIGIFGANRILNGDIPYLDFWTIYAPGYFYFLAGFLKIFGNSIIVERIFSIIIMFSVLILIFRITLKLSINKYRYIPIFIVLTWFGYSPFWGKAVPLALLFGLIGVLLIINLENRNKFNYLFFAGFFTALATITRHDFGFYFFVPLLIASFFKGYKNYSLEKTSSKLFSAIKYNIFFLLGLFIVLMPVVIYFANNVGLDSLYHHLIYIPSKIFPLYRSLPYPVPFVIPEYLGEISTFRAVQTYIENLIFYFPAIIYLVMLFKISISIQRKHFDINYITDAAILILTILGILLYNQTTVRAEREHLIPTLTISLILFVYILKDLNKSKFVNIALVLIISLLYVVPLSNKLNLIKKSYFSPNTYCFDIPRAKGICDEKQWAIGFEKVVDYIMKNTSGTEKILVANYSHDRVLMNDLMIYYVSERQSATKYHEFHPGITTRLDVQEEIVNEIKDNSVNCIILCPNTDFPEPNASRISSNVYILDNFINKYYSEHKMFGGYKIMMRNSNSFD